MSIDLKMTAAALQALTSPIVAIESDDNALLPARLYRNLVHDARAAQQLHALINNPHTTDFLQAVKLEAAHQRDRFGDAHNRNKSAENWFWLVGYLAGKCLRSIITGDKPKALHHTISSAAALANWYEAIKRDQSGAGIGADNDIKPVEIARFEGPGAVDCGECPFISTGCSRPLGCMKAQL